METSQTTNLVLERLTAWVDVEAVWYRMGSKKGKGPAAEEKASDQNPYQKKAEVIWEVTMSGVLLLYNPR